jgi:hypothetical protein
MSLDPPNGASVSPRSAGPRVIGSCCILPPLLATFNDPRPPPSSRLDIVHYSLSLTLLLATSILVAAPLLYTSLSCSPLLHELFSLLSLTLFLQTFSSFNMDDACNIGTSVDINGNVYEGEYLGSVSEGAHRLYNDLGWGKGKMIYKNGDVIESEHFIGGVVTGKGKAYNTSKGWSYEGQMRQSLFEGFGVYRDTDASSVYKGRFIASMKHGWGELSDEKGVLYCRFSKGKPDGRGYMALKSGVLCYADWRDGAMLSDSIHSFSAPTPPKHALDAPTIVGKLTNDKLSSTYEGEIKGGEPWGKGRRQKIIKSDPSGKGMKGTVIVQESDYFRGWGVYGNVTQYRYDLDAGLKHYEDMKRKNGPVLPNDQFYEGFMWLWDYEVCGFLKKASGTYFGGWSCMDKGKTASYNSFNGFGIMDRFDGDGEFAGSGTYYEGEQINGICHGYGYEEKRGITEGEGKYQGYFKDHMRHGEGILTTDAGILFCTFRTGIPHGRGKLFNRDGSVIYGEWRNGLLDQDTMVIQTKEEHGSFLDNIIRNEKGEGRGVKGPVDRADSDGNGGDNDKRRDSNSSIIIGGFIAMVVGLVLWNRNKSL